MVINPELFRSDERPSVHVPSPARPENNRIQKNLRSIHILSHRPSLHVDPPERLKIYLSIHGVRHLCPKTQRQWYALENDRYTVSRLPYVDRHIIRLFALISARTTSIPHETWNITRCGMSKIAIPCWTRNNARDILRFFFLVSNASYLESRVRAVSPHHCETVYEFSTNAHPYSVTSYLSNLSKVTLLSENSKRPQEDEKQLRWKIKVLNLKRSQNSHIPFNSSYIPPVLNTIQITRNLSSLSNTP